MKYQGSVQRYFAAKGILFFAEDTEVKKAYQKMENRPLSSNKVLVMAEDSEE